MDQFRTKLTTANSVLLLLPPQPDFDSVAAALALRLAISNTGKQALVGCSTPVSQEHPELPQADQIQKNIGNQTLVVSFDYREDSVENVSYDIDDATHKFNLRIQPRADKQPLDSSQVQFSYTGAAADLVVTFGINSLEELGSLYSEEKLFLDAAEVVNFTQSTKPSTFAALNLPVSTTFSEAVASLIKDADYKLDEQLATLLFQQLAKSTGNFLSPAASADSFELAAYLIRQGAQRTPTFAPPRPFMPASGSPEPIPPLMPTPKIYRGGNPLR